VSSGFAHGGEVLAGELLCRITASLPPLVKNTRLKSPGASPAGRAAEMEAVLDSIDGALDQGRTV